MNLYALQMSDPNMLSYSALQDLHSCPRRFELNKKLAHKQISTEDEPIDFAFGHAVAAGVQEYILSKDTNKALLACLVNWRCSLLEDKLTKKKSAFYAAFAVQKFIQEYDLLLPDWELMYFDGVPAIELTFLIQLPRGKKYRGDIDAVLRHRKSGKVMVLEIKTTSFHTVDEAVYGKSAQALGYGVVLDQIIPESSSYDVLYLVYQTPSMEWKPMPFHKNRTQKALWIKDLLSDLTVLTAYEKGSHFPQRGESCFSFFRRCAHYDYCGMPNASLGISDTELAQERANEIRRYGLPTFQFNFELADIITRQHQLLLG